MVVLSRLTSDNKKLSVIKEKQQINWNFFWSPEAPNKIAGQKCMGHQRKNSLNGLREMVPSGPRMLDRVYKHVQVIFS